VATLRGVLPSTGLSGPLTKVGTEVSRRWFGRRAYFNINPIVGGGSTFEMDFSFDGPEFNDGDSLLRILLGWQMQTDLTDFEGVPDRGPWPAFVTARFNPDPDGDPGIGAPPIGGDALWRESVDWRRRHFTDGSTNSYCWEAHSGPMRSGQGQRKAIDKTISEVACVVSFDNTAADDFPLDVGYVPLNAFGFVWLELLVQQ